VIATFGIASTGISIDLIHHLVLVDAGKAFTRVIQSIGRGLRRGKGKTKVFVSDIFSQLKWSKKHWRQRLDFYREAEYPTRKIEKAVL
jgi:superfamily II DNA or RNA helicase